MSMTEKEQKKNIENIDDWAFKRFEGLVKSHSELFKDLKDNINELRGDFKEYKENNNKQHEAFMLELKEVAEVKQWFKNLKFTKSFAITTLALVGMIIGIIVSITKLLK